MSEWISQEAFEMWAQHNTTLSPLGRREAAQMMVKHDRDHPQPKKIPEWVREGLREVAWRESDIPKVEIDHWCNRAEAEANKPKLNAIQKRINEMDVIFAYDPPIECISKDALMQAFADLPEDK